MSLIRSLSLHYFIASGHAVSSLRGDGSFVQRLGEKLLSVDDLISQSVAVGNGDAAAESVRKQIDGDSEVLASPRVSEVLENANSMMRDAATEDLICKRDWEGCPDGWARAGGACRAPASYNGACSHFVAFEGATLRSKEKFSEECQAPWPCAGSCKGGQDYENPLCPIGWVGNGGFCELNGTPAANRKCGSRYLFTSMSTKDKQSLASVCGIKWPCRTACDPDYGSECPDGWISDERGGICIAPATYAGDCSYEVAVRGWHHPEKEAFAAACAAPYPCLTSGAVDAERGIITRRQMVDDGPIDVKGFVLKE